MQNKIPTRDFNFSLVGFGYLRLDKCRLIPLNVLNILLNIFHFVPTEVTVGAGAINANTALAVFPKLAAQGTTGFAGLHCDFSPYGI